MDQRAPQIARPQNDGGVPQIHAQDLGNLIAQALHVIAIALLAELAKAAQVLADLAGGEVHGLAQGGRGDAHYAHLIQGVQLAVITGQTADNRIGYFSLFHASPAFPDVSPPQWGAGRC